MPPELDIRRHLETELASPDPWRLDANPFEQRRFDAMMALIAPSAPFGRGLEVGCAAGAFTARLAPCCRRLDVIDVVPEALERAAARLPDAAHVTWEIADIAGDFDPTPRFDLIVVAEVLYYVDGPEALRRAVDTLGSALLPGGILVFGSAVDDACRRWGLFGGAETAMAEWDRRLRETARLAITGADWGENCLVVSYRREPEASVT
ncbi:MAG: SAM-dependent methyltransferase [Phenylobacterium sp.]